MKCQDCQRDLLSAEELETLPAETEAHLAECAVCREFQQQLLQIEHNVPRLPVPPSRTKAQVLDKVLHPAAPPPRPLPLPGRRPRWRTFVWSAGGVAAAVALVACGIYLGNLLSGALHRNDAPIQVKGNGPRPVTPLAKGPPPSPPRLTTRLLESDLRLAEADNPRERVEALADLADALTGEVKILAPTAAAKELTLLAGLYGKIVQDGVVPRARALPVAERQETLAPIVKQLERTQGEAGDLARKVPESAAAPLRVIAAAAQTGQRQLRNLMAEDSE